MIKLEKATAVPVPYDKDEASRELRRKKRNGDVHYTERLPKKRSMEKLRKEFSSMTVREIFEQSQYQHGISSSALNVTPAQRPLERLLELCHRISTYDFGYQNLSSEVPRAEKEALEILELAKEVKSIVDNIGMEDARMAKGILKIMNVPFMRVLGDRLERIPFEGTNLEKWLKNVGYDDANLQLLVRKEELVQNVYTYSAV